MSAVAEFRVYGGGGSSTNSPIWGATEDGIFYPFGGTKEEMEETIREVDSFKDRGFRGTPVEEV